MKRFVCWKSFRFLFKFICTARCVHFVAYVNNFVHLFDSQISLCHDPISACEKDLISNSQRKTNKEIYLINALRKGALVLTLVLVLLTSSS